MKKYLLLLVLYISAAQTYAQNKVIRGVVTSDSTHVASASVYEKDVPQNGTITNDRGEFQLTLRGKGTLVIRSVGYKEQEVNVDGKSSLTIKLYNESKDLNDVVVIGYGVKKKITNTGAIAAINGDEIRETPTASLQNSLVGRLPGFFSQQRSGEPGKDGAGFLIRGVSTITNDPNNASASPLIIVDDLEYGGSISEIDADQIESLTILKDASTTAVYGVKGANGVIVITTRRGKLGRPQVSIRSETGGQAPTFMPKFLDSYHSAMLRNQALANDGLPAFWTAQDIQLFKDGTDPYGHPNVDWLKTLIRPYSVQTDNHLNISGGTEKAKYFVSAGYLWQNGDVKNFSTPDLNSNYYYKRYNFRSNLDVAATKTLSLNLDMSGNYSEQNEPNIGGRNNRNKVLFEINDYVQLPPFAYQPFNPNGTYGANPSMFGIYSNNVIGRFALGGFNRSFDNDVTINLRATQKLDFITKGLSIKAIVGYNAYFRFWRSQTRSDAFPSFGYNAQTGVYTPFNPTVYEIPKLALGYYADAPNSYKKLNYQGSINYDRNFDGHHIYALGLFNQTSNITGINTPIIFRGFVGRVGYDYEQKYLVEFNGAYNGTSVFSSDKRYAVFPAVSGGWNVAKEDFFQRNVKFVNVFKLRASWGKVGSDQLPNNPATGVPYNYVYIQNYATGGSYSIGNVSRSITGIVEGTLGTDVTWEKETQVDYGTDIKMFNGHVGLTADYFDRERNNILITRGSVSTILGVGVPPVNLGRVRNRGYEIELTYNNTIGKVNYSVRGNISVAKNKILFQDEAQPTYPYLAGTGHSVGYLIGYTYQGFYKDSLDVASSPPTPIAAKPGDPKYADLNHDGKVDVNDERVLKYTNLPNTNLGFTGTVGYKGWALSFTLQSALNFVQRRTLTGNYTTERLDSWTPTNKNALLPRLTTVASVGDYDSDFWFRRMDYLRLKTVMLAYSLPSRWVQRISLHGIRVYASGYNLLTWMLVQKNIYDFDPEAPTSTEGGEYPIQKVVTLGAQITF